MQFPSVACGLWYFLSRQSIVFPHLLCPGAPNWRQKVVLRTQPGGEPPAYWTWLNFEVYLVYFKHTCEARKCRWCSKEQVDHWQCTGVSFDQHCILYNSFVCDCICVGYTEVRAHPVRSHFSYFFLSVFCVSQAWVDRF